MKKYAWFVLLIVGSIVIYLFARGMNSDSPELEAGIHDPKANSSQINLPDSQTSDIPTAPSDKKSRLVDVLADQVARRGISSPEVADLVAISQSACFAYSEETKKGIKGTGWANDYLAYACEGFDASNYQGVQDPAPDFLEISIADGEHAVEEAALGYLERPKSVMAALEAGITLVGSGKLPGQASYGLSADQLTRAFTAANAATMCPGPNGCVAAQVLVASTCVKTSCPVGLTYEAALRRNLSPAELEASERLSKWLISIRK